MFVQSPTTVNAATAPPDAYDTGPAEYKALMLMRLTGLERVERRNGDAEVFDELVALSTASMTAQLRPMCGLCA